MNNNISHFEDDIEILDDFGDMPEEDELSIQNKDVKNQVDETVRSQLNAFSNQRLYNNNYGNTSNRGVYGYNQPRSGQPLDNVIEEKIEPETFEVEDIMEETPTYPTPQPVVEDLFAEPVVEPVQPVTPVVNQPVVEKPTPLEKTSGLMTIPELEKTAVYPSGVIPIPKNEPVDDSDKNANKNTKALMFIIGLFVLLALVIFIVLPLVNPV